jgi:hypothetical protein
MSEVVYRSEVQIERVNRSGRKMHLPAESEPVISRVHGAMAEDCGTAVLPPRLNREYS